jgi:hypothetical protein
MAALPDVMPPETEEGLAVVHGKNASLHIVSGTAHGLANGLYELRRRLLVAEDGGLEAQELLREGVHAPHFKQRDFYHFLSPWRLQHLSCDTFTPGEWKTHLDRMRALNANRFYFDIWSDFDALAAGYDALQSLRPSSRNVYFPDLFDLVAILNLLAGYLKKNREQVAEPSFYPPADLVEETRLKMTGPRIFEAYTANQHWIARSDEVIGQRIRWWLQAIATELGLSGCNTE